MRTIIIYATKHGATKTIAESIASLLEKVTLCNINENPDPSIADYDCVILGSPLTAGMVRKEIKNFVQKHGNELKSKQFGLYISGLEAGGEAGYLKRNFSEDVLDAAKAKAFLGGVFDPEKCGFFARNVIKLIAKLDRYTSTIDDEKIRDFARKLAV